MSCLHPTPVPIDWINAKILSFVAMNPVKHISVNITLRHPIIFNTTTNSRNTGSLNICENSSWPPNPNRLYVTQLFAPPMQRRLMIDHYDEVENDVIDYYYRILGTAVHSVIEKAAKDRIGISTEVRVAMPKEWFGLGGHELFSVAHKNGLGASDIFVTFILSPSTFLKQPCSQT